MCSKQLYASPARSRKGLGLCLLLAYYKRLPEDTTRHYDRVVSCGARKVFFRMILTSHWQENAEPDFASQQLLYASFRQTLSAVTQTRIPKAQQKLEATKATQTLDLETKPKSSEAT